MGRTEDEVELPLGEEAGIKKIVYVHPDYATLNWTGNDENQLNHSVIVDSRWHKKSVSVYWKGGRGSDPFFVGSFAVDIKQLERTSLVARHNDGKHRFRLMHVGNEIRLQRGRGLPYVVLGKVDFSRSSESSENQPNAVGAEHDVAPQETTGAEGDLSTETSAKKPVVRTWMLFPLGVLAGIVSTLLLMRIL